MKPVCLVIGSGAGIGGTVGARFAREGFHTCLCRRSDAAGLKKLVDGIQNDGFSASGFLLNAIEDDVLEERIALIESEIGSIEVVVYNLGAQIGSVPLEETS